ncbi:MAG: Nif3-like dinuclear metal center hexameric protein [Gammaproteobacteria bacterium]|nr:Nif3-like dinuclear metal center hexameric protein [Gammaproteobacteria bacterium]
MKLEKIINRLDELYPEYLKASYDNVGLMVGSLEKEVKNVYISLDLTREAMDEAIEAKADLILTHHPLLFRPLYSINLDKDPGSIVKDLIKEDISLFSMHTNFDTVRMNELLGNMLGLTNHELLSEKENCGIVGETNIHNFKDFINHVKSTFKLDEIYYIGKENIEINRVALCAGAGQSMINDAYAKNSDIYLTGDISYSRALEAKRLGQNILVIPHYVESLFYLAIKEDIKELDPSLNIYVSKLDPNPFIKY